jgi:hypothetical protein
MDALRCARMAAGIGLSLLVVGGCADAGKVYYPRPEYMRKAELAADAQDAAGDELPPLELPNPEDVPPGLQPIIDYVRAADEAAKNPAAAAPRPETQEELRAAAIAAGLIDPSQSVPPKRGTEAAATGAAPLAESESGVLTPAPPAETASDAGADEPPAKVEPPMLTGLQVNANDPLSVEVSSPSDDSARVNTRAEVTPDPASLEKLLAQWAAQQAVGDSFRAQLDRRLVLVLSGEYAEARKPFELVTNEQQKLGNRFVEALIAIRETHLGNLHVGAERVLAEIEPLVEDLSRASDLTIPRFTLCSRVDAYGSYTPLDPPRFTTGRPIAFVTYAEIRNLVAQHEGEEYVTKLDMTTTVFSDRGEALKRIEDAGIVDRCRNRRRDFFVAREIRLPATLAPGTYVVKVAITDTLGEKVAESRTEFQVKVP